MAFYKMKVGCACVMLRMLLHHDCCIVVPGSVCSGVSGVAVVCADLGRVISCLGGKTGSHRRYR